MDIHHQHPWNISTTEASQIQTQLREQIDLTKTIDISAIKTIAAADISFSRGSTTLSAAVVLYRFADLKQLKVYQTASEVHFPYIPGYLSFREIPALLKIFKNINEKIDVILCDAQGIAHPRRFGLACHLGVLLDIPTIGCAKSRLIGQYEEPQLEAGNYSPLVDNGDIIGSVMRTRDNVSPIYVSPGHKITLAQAREIVMQCVDRYRIPIPLRSAHIEVNKYRKQLEAQNSNE